MSLLFVADIRYWRFVITSGQYGYWPSHTALFPLYQERTRTSREYLFNGLNHLMEQHLINRDDLIAYLGGGFGEGKGTTFLEINRVGEVLDNFDHYTLPNMEDTEA